MDSNLYLDEYIDFQKYWLVLKRRWIPGTATFVGIVAFALIKSLSMPKIYEAEAEILIKADRSSKLTGIENVTGDIEGLANKSDPLTTEAEILKSRPIVEKLIEELDLRNDAGELLRHKAIDLKVKPITGTDLLKISFTNKDPELAALVVNEAIEVYIQDHKSNNIAEAAAATKFISEQLPQIEAHVRKAEANLRRFKNQNQIANLGEETTANIDSLSNITNQIDQVAAELKDINARYDRLRVQLDMSWQEASAVRSLSESLAVQRSLEQLQTVKVELAQKSNVLSDLAPQIIALKEQEADLTALLDRQIAQTLGKEQQNLIKKVDLLSLGAIKDSRISEFANLGLQKEGLEQKLVNLKKTYSSYQQKSGNLPGLQEQQRELERRVEAAQSTYQTLLGKLQETQIAKQQNIGNVRVVASAIVPEQPIGPSKKMIVGGAGVVGALLGIAVAFLVDIRDRTIKNTQEIEEMLTYPLQGIVPEHPAHQEITTREQLLLPDSSTINSPQLAATKIPSLSIREIYHNMQVNLQMFDKEAAHKVIVVTSAVAGEGKSSVSANLAIAKAQSGQKVLLVDGDLRRPSQHKLWNVPNEEGLTNVLNREAPWYDILYHSMPNLDLMTSGTIPKHPVTLLDSQTMEEFIASVAIYYDYVIFDTPPLVGLADTKILGKLVDGLLLVVRPGVANYASVTAAQKILAVSDINPLGVVANGVDFDQEPYSCGDYYLDEKYAKVAQEKAIDKNLFATDVPLTLEAILDPENSSD